LSIGSKSALQVELYDKSKEISDTNGKTWFYALWARGHDGQLFDRDVWRLEIRMSGDYLKERNVRRSHELMAQRGELIREAVTKKRLTVPSTSDAQRWRWPLHPLWSVTLPPPFNPG
jgi:hypothetical protein